MMINHFNKEIDTSDPYKLDRIEDYFKCMDNIFISKSYIQKC